MLKCMYLLFDTKKIFKNTANYITMGLFIFSIMSLFSFRCCNYNNVKKYINKLKINENKIIEKESKKNVLDEKNKISLSMNNIDTKRNKKSSRFLNTSLNSSNSKNSSNTKNKKIKTNKRKTKKRSSLFNKKNDLTKEQGDNIIGGSNYRLQSKNLKMKNKELNTNNKNRIITNETQFNDREMNSLKYENAIKRDNRTYCQYYISLLRTKHILIFTFCNINDYNPQIIKIYIFFYTYAINYLVSAMFYSDETMHKILIDQGSFDFTYQLPQMFYSLIISSMLKSILNHFGLCEDNILSFKYGLKTKEKKEKLLSNIRRKIIVFFIVTYILLFFFWIYLGCFCAVYKNTQIHLLIDVSSSFAFSFITPIFVCLIPGIFRINSLKDKKNKKPYIFKISQILQML